MSRSKSKTSEPSTAAKSGAASVPQQGTNRETLESIVVAFVLAFLFRTFIAEAFVIPTGSMAPTLFGRHKDVKCPECGLHYEVGASEELDREEGVRLQMRIKTATCPNCRYTSNIFSLPVFTGDRILVNKFPYEVGDVHRWDVCVFKFPEEPERNYIKRLVGMPGETIRLMRGDVYTRTANTSDFQIQRKADPNKQDKLQILVYDDVHPPKKLLAQGWPERWAAVRRDDGPGAIDGWTEHSDDGQHNAADRTFTLASEADWRWLRYRHLVPTEFDWESVAEGHKPASNPKPQLVNDYYGYNAYTPQPEPIDDVFWVGDLTISGVIDLQQTGNGAALQLELVEGVRRYRCEIDVKTGKATLTHTNELQPEGEPIQLGTGDTAVTGPGRYKFAFANVDDRLCLWINSRLTQFEGHGEYLPAALPNPQEADLLPAGLAVRHATAQFSKLLLRRDIYYRAERIDDTGMLRPGDGEDLNGFDKNRLRDLLSNPDNYANIYNQKTGPVEFAQLRDDEYFVMGDNSPRSQDSRLWSNKRGAANRHAVPRQAMVGKAYAIYWPHGIPFLNGGHGYGILNHSVDKHSNVPNYPKWYVPFYPQLDRFFKRIR